MPSSASRQFRSRLLAVLAIASLAAVAAPSAHAASIATVAGGAGNGAPECATGIATALAPLVTGGDTVTNLGYAPAADLTLYDRVFVCTSTQDLTASGFPASKFNTYLAQGGQLVIVSEHFVGAADLAVINAVLAASVTTPAVVAGRPAPPSCKPNEAWASCIPNTQALVSGAACGVVTAPAANMIMTENAGALFTGADMKPGVTGTLAIMMDYSWLNVTGGGANALAVNSMMATAAAGGGGDCAAVGCADGSREGFTSISTYPTIASCGGAWTVPGVWINTPACARQAGNHGTNSAGTGCNVQDLCAPGWRVCNGPDDVASRTGEAGCADAVSATYPNFGTGDFGFDPTGVPIPQPPAGPGGAFFMTRTSGPGTGLCEDVVNGTPTSFNDVFGCGNLGRPVSGTCSPLNRFGSDLCNGLQNYIWPGSSDKDNPASDYGYDTAADWAWSCGSNGVQESNNVVKRFPNQQGGVICCKINDEVLPEICDGVNNDGDALIDETDQFGDDLLVPGDACPASGCGVVQCTANGGWTCANTPCDDNNPCTVKSCASGCAHTSLAAGTACTGGVCNGAATNPACVECLSDTQCGGDTPHCNVATNKCVACVTAGQCNDQVACTVDACVNNACTHTPADAGTACQGGVCSGASAICVQCVSDTQCSGSTPHCNVATNKCVECVNAEQCDDGVQCTVDACGEGNVCTHTASQPGTACDGGVCSGDTKKCVECVSDTQCSGDESHCNVASNTCVECVSSEHCDDSLECTVDACSEGHTCSNTLAEAGAPCDGGVCSGDTTMCVECASDADCGGDNPHCNPTTNGCVACVTAAHCDDEIECTVDACGSNNTCSNGLAEAGAPCDGGVCSGDTTMCVECVADTQCGGDIPHCNTADNSCVECVNAGQCADGDACSEDACDGNKCVNTPNATVGDDCSVGLGECLRSGVIVCQEDGSTACDAEVVEGSTEVCDSKDNDCDGETDATDLSLAAGSCGDDLKGVCAGAVPPASYCVEGSWEPCDAAVFAAHAPTTYVADGELCDGLDNNCDGATDEGLGLGDDCTVGLGVCKASGSVVCGVDGKPRCNATAGTPSADVCDGLDNNCDGATDAVGQGASVCTDIDTEITSGPESITASTSATFLYKDPLNPTGTVFDCQLDGGDWEPCDGGSASYSGLAEGSHTLLVRSVRGDGVVDETPAVYGWIIDTSQPDTSFITKPDLLSQSATATFAFGCTVPDPLAYYCALDLPAATPGDGFVECQQTEVYTMLSEGSHTLRVYCVNQAGTPDPQPAVHTWSIDTVAPDTIITSGPPAVTAETVGTLTFAGAGGATVTGFQCRLDGGEWEPCDSGSFETGTLADGQHVFQVAAIDAAGNVDPSPAVHVWVVDTEAPETSVLIGPQNPSQSNDATFSFACTDPKPDAYFCSVDPPTGADPVFAECPQAMVLTALAEGSHTVLVYCVSAAGTPDPTPEVVTWLIDSTFPDTVITTKPASLVSTADENDFTYADPDEPDHQAFDCRLDDGAWFECDGKAFTAGPLAVGTHQFFVRACQRDLEQCDPTPAIYVWEVTQSPCPLDKVAPTITCDAAVTYECVDGGSSVKGPTAQATDACDPVTVATTAPETFALGTTAVVLSASDGNGNVSSCVSLVTVADTTPPTITCPDAVSVST
ncbi:MAG: MopE-related protein, partial [Myxococcota bacterium]